MSIKQISRPASIFLAVLCFITSLAPLVFWNPVLTEGNYLCYYIVFAVIVVGYGFCANLCALLRHCKQLNISTGFLMIKTAVFAFALLFVVLSIIGSLFCGHVYEYELIIYTLAMLGVFSAGIGYIAFLAKDLGEVEF